MVSVGDVIGDCPKCELKTIIYKGGDEAVCNSCGEVYEVSFDDEEVSPPPAPAPVPAPAPAPVSVPDQAAQPVRPVQQAIPVGPETAQPHTPEPVTPSIPQSGLTEAPTAFQTPEVETRPEPTLGQHEAEHAPPKVHVESSGQLSEVYGESLLAKKGSLRLGEPGVGTPGFNVDIPEHIKKSRPWRWAQIQKETGNPYRFDTKNWKIFQIASEGPHTVYQMIGKLLEKHPDVCERLNYLLTVYEVLAQCIAAGLLVIDQETGMIQACSDKPIPHPVP